MAIRKVRSLPVIIFAVVLVVFCAEAGCLADTFKHRTTGEVLHGYATSKTQGSITFVQTQEKGEQKLNLGEWDVVRDKAGREEKVVVLAIDDSISLYLESKAFEKAIKEASDKGPLFILLEIDTPGGSIEIAQQICGSITDTTNCEVICFIKGGDHGGAISAGVAIAFSCDKIYMADNSIIGGATAVVEFDYGLKDIKKSLGETIGEKINSIWQASLASLAEKNGRPGLLAKAMVEKELEIIEIAKGGERVFIDAVNKSSGQKVVHTWSKKGSLLTLTAGEAIKCGIADEIANSRGEVLRDLGADKAEIVTNRDTQKARTEFKRAVLKANNLMKEIDLKTKQLTMARERPKALSLLRNIRKDFKMMLTLTRRYPDFRVNPQVIEEQLNSVEAVYDGAKTESRR